VPRTRGKGKKGPQSEQIRKGLSEFARDRHAHQAGGKYVTMESFHKNRLDKKRQPPPYDLVFRADFIRRPKVPLSEASGGEAWGGRGTPPQRVRELGFVEKKTGWKKEAWGGKEDRRKKKGN